MGHKPSGDSPAVCSSVFTGVEVVSADTSFSDASAKDNRGSAVASVVIEGTPHENHTRLHGVLRDGRGYDGCLGTVGGALEPTGGDTVLGTQDTDGWWYKAFIPQDSGRGVYLVSRGEGRHVQYKDVDAPLYAKL